MNYKNKIKTFISVCLLMLGITSSIQAATLSTNILSAGVYILSTNRASIYNVELTSAYATTVTFYDSDAIAAPYYGTNYVSGAYPYRQTYATNYVTSYIGSNGYTNWYTNSGVWTITLTNAAATNVLPVLGTFVVAPNTYAVYDTSMLVARGVAVQANTNVSIVVNYRTGQ